MMSSVSTACFEESVWIRVTGRGSFQCSPYLKNLVQTMLDQGHLTYILDLARCEQMDSTFMGTVTGIALRLKKISKGNLKVINVNHSNEDLMKNLGLHQLFCIQPLSQGMELPPVSIENCFSQNAETPCEKRKEVVQETVLSAHQALVDADQENASKFKNVFEVI